MTIDTKAMFLIVGLRLLWSGCYQLFAASQVSRERNTFIGGRVFRDYLYSSVFDVLFSLIIVLGAIFGRIELDLSVWISLIMIVLFWLKCRAVDRLALVLAGIVREPIGKEKNREG